MTMSPMQKLLENGNWGDQQVWFDRLCEWDHYPILLSLLKTIKREALYVSVMHGEGHIERTILQGAFGAMEERLNEADTQLLLLCCAYHDVGRVNDHVDDLHGQRSAERFAELTGVSGEDLLIARGAIDAHSRKEAVLEKTITLYGAQDFARAKRIAQLLKDADGLDRVRLGDLNPRYLRYSSSKTRVELAQEVFDRYQVQIGAPKGPVLGEEIAKKLRELDALSWQS